MTDEPSGRPVRGDDAVVLEFPRTLPAPPGHVWSSLTGSARAELWVGPRTGVPEVFDDRDAHLPVLADRFWALTC